MKRKNTGKTTLKSGRGRPRKEANWTGALLLKHSKYYFDKCDSRTRQTVNKDGDVINIPCPAPYTIEGLCLHLGIATTTFRRWWEEGGARSRAIGLLRQKITENRVTGALDGVQNPSFARFMLTNNNPDEYAEKVNVEGSVDPKLASIFDAIVANKIGGK